MVRHPLIRTKEVSMKWFWQTHATRRVPRKAPQRKPSFRPVLESLESRLTPSLSPTGVSLDTITAHAVVGGVQQVNVAVESTAGTEGFNPTATLNTATYITGTTGSATAAATTADSSGNTYTAGTITDTSGNVSAYVAKYDSSGNQVYLSTFQLQDSSMTTLNTKGLAVAVDSSGDAFIAGTTANPNTSVQDAFTAKLSSDGSQIVWADDLGSQTTGAGISVKSDGTSVTTGTYSGASDGLNHLFAIRLSADGSSADYYYYYQFGTTTMPDLYATQGNAVALNNNSTVSTKGSLAVIAGNIIFTDSTGNTNQDVFTFEIDNGTNALTEGNGKWANLLTDTNPDTLTGAAFNTDDTPVMSGTLTTSTGTVGVLLKYPADGGMGNPTFANTDANATAFNAIAIDSNGNLYAAGTSSTGAYVAKISSDGATIIDDISFGTTGDSANGVSAGSKIWVVGSTTSSTLSTDTTTLNGTQDGFLANITFSM
jgi:hypothetical protein